MTRGVLIGVGRGEVGVVGRSGARITVGSIPPGGTSIPLVWCGSFTSRAMPTSGASGLGVFETRSTMAGDGAGAKPDGSGATGVPIGVGLGFTFDAAISASVISRMRNTRALLASVT